MTDAVQELLEDLAGAVTPGRTKLDRYREFRQVFLGSDAGKRVLRDILALGHVYAHAPIRETNRTFEWLGERKLAIEVLSIINLEPAAQKPQAGRSKPEE